MAGRKFHQILTEGINPDQSLSSSQSGISISLSREDILAVYEEGPEAVVALVQTLCSITNKQAARIDELEERIKSLEDQISQIAAAHPAAELRGMQGAAARLIKIQ
jgi:hypothetical protein